MPYDPAERSRSTARRQSRRWRTAPAGPDDAAALLRPREENADACRSERVTVPAAEGEREITVVRC